MAEPINELIGDGNGSILRTGPVLIFSPAGRARKRFPENCVTIYESEEAALAAAKPDEGYHAAIATGPSRSFEGFYLYYLLRWLD